MQKWSLLISKKKNIYIYASLPYTILFSSLQGMVDGEQLYGGVHKFLKEVLIGDVTGVIKKMVFIGKNAIVQKMAVMVAWLHVYLAFMYFYLSLWFT